MSRSKKGVRLLPYLQTLDYHNFMDARREHKDPEGEMKDSYLLTAKAVASVSAFGAQFSEPQYPQDDAKRTR